MPWRVCLLNCMLVFATVMILHGFFCEGSLTTTCASSPGCVSADGDVVPSTFIEREPFRVGLPLACPGEHPCQIAGRYGRRSGFHRPFGGACLSMRHSVWLSSSPGCDSEDGYVVPSSRNEREPPVSMLDFGFLLHALASMHAKLQAGICNGDDFTWLFFARVL